MKKFRMTPTLDQFKANITKHADVLRRHGLADPVERKQPKRLPRNKSEPVVDLASSEAESVG